MINIIVAAILIAILGSAIFYIVRAKRRGTKCIGCPAADSCSHSCHQGTEHASGSCGCHPETK